MERKEDGEDVHHIDDPVALLRLKVGAPVASDGGSRVRVDAIGVSDGGRAVPHRGAPVGGAVHGFGPGRLSCSSLDSIADFDRSAGRRRREHLLPPPLSNITRRGAIVARSQERQEGK